MHRSTLADCRSHLLPRIATPASTALGQPSNQSAHKTAVVLEKLYSAAPSILGAHTRFLAIEFPTFLKEERELGRGMTSFRGRIKKKKRFRGGARHRYSIDYVVGRVIPNTELPKSVHAVTSLLPV